MRPWRPSAKSPACTAALQKLIASAFPPEYITVVDGGHEVGDLCLSERFDKIFYTGSPKVGRHVLRMAADHLTSTSLELGGETGNWCVVRGGCINEVCLQLMVRGAPFNGTGHSGMGAYHGEWGFREFTHPSTVLIGARHLNLPLREHPYTRKQDAWKKPLLRLFMR